MLYSFFFSFCFRSLFISLLAIPMYFEMIPCWFSPGSKSKKVTLKKKEKKVTEAAINFLKTIIFYRSEFLRLRYTLMGRSNMISIIPVGIYYPQKLLVSYLPISGNTHCLFLPHAQYCLPWLSLLCLSSAKTTNSLKTRTQLLVIFLCSHISLITA